ncbi:flagellar basal body P-ring formation chaperone FlgA [Falsirhodobacter deserti]|uniref:flagellar basal body P-ring formation chaperone FlgA n=1 Tax=Falsirhodobacter deserti TaxID=1365611 RepID=UPI000FE31B03|nr:flagellar basal body P-ring formation chaperone FlgA [Falsirhodobacter deserti]
MIPAALILALLPAAAGADTVLAGRTLRAETVLSAEDVKTVPGTVSGALDDPRLAIGMEARVTLYAGRPIKAEDLGPPAIVTRNQLVPLSFYAGGLSILTEGRALGRGGAGDVIRVMNLQSRTTVSGRVSENGQVIVKSGL